MPWILLFVGLLLIALGAWGGPRSRRRRAAAREGSEFTANAAAGQMAEADIGALEGDGTHPAWEVLTRPMDLSDPAIEFDEHRPWDLPSKDRRFLQGTSIGLGTGFVVGALILMMQPAPAPASPAAGSSAAFTSAPSSPTPSSKAPTSQPSGATSTGTSAPTPAGKANVRFLVEPGQIPVGVAGALKAAGLVADEKAFVNRLIERKLDTQLKAGFFNIPPGSSVDTVIDILVGLQ